MLIFNQTLIFANINFINIISKKIYNFINQKLLIIYIEDSRNILIISNFCPIKKYFKQIY